MHNDRKEYCRKIDEKSLKQRSIVEKRTEGKKGRMGKERRKTKYPQVPTIQKLFIIKFTILFYKNESYSLVLLLLILIVEPYLLA